MHCTAWKVGNAGEGANVAEDDLTLTIFNFRTSYLFQTATAI
jgi:hypothetical protein